MKGFPNGKMKSDLLGHTDRDHVVNWQNGPYNRRLYKDLGRLLPMVSVWRGRGKVSAFDYQIRDVSGARFGQMMLQSGFFNGQQIVAAEWVRACRFGDTRKYVVEY